MFIYSNLDDIISIYPIYGIAGSPCYKYICSVVYNESK